MKNLFFLTAVLFYTFSIKKFIKSKKTFQLFLLLITLLGCTNNQEKKDEVNWTYSEIDYPMTESKAIEANLYSSTNLNLEGVINYSPKFILNIRQFFPVFLKSVRDFNLYYLEKNEEIIISIKCENCPTLKIGSQELKYIIDDNRPQTYYGRELSNDNDGLKRWHFNVDSKSFIENLIKSDSLKLEFPFISHGKQIIDFNVKGLKSFKSFFNDNGVSSSLVSKLNLLEDEYKVKDTWIGNSPSYEIINPINNEPLLIPEAKYIFQFLSNNNIIMEVFPKDKSIDSYKMKGIYNGDSWHYITAKFNDKLNSEYYYFTTARFIPGISKSVSKLRVSSSNTQSFNLQRESSKIKKDIQVVENLKTPPSTQEMIEVVEDKEEIEETLIESKETDETQVLNSLEKNINHTLKNYKNFVYSFKTSKFLIRIDELEDNSYRYASWNKSSKFKDKPSLVLKNGERFYEGSGGNNYFLFKSGAYSYKIWENKVSSKTSAYTLEVYQNKKIIVEQESIE